MAQFQKFLDSVAPENVFTEQKSTCMRRVPSIEHAKAQSGRLPAAFTDCSFFCSSSAFNQVMDFFFFWKKTPFKTETVLFSISLSLHSFRKE